mmetsp:Transcript_8866/g.16090  ORF Transcript_8866/g.16090 Transcript_8866/m.16090 type:complete len:84 (-) Transcript_8866:240-491(-)
MHLILGANNNVTASINLHPSSIDARSDGISVGVEAILCTQLKATKVVNSTKVVLGGAYSWVCVGAFVVLVRFTQPGTSQRHQS